MLAAETTERDTKTWRERPIRLAGSMASLFRFGVDGAWQANATRHTEYGLPGEQWGVLLTTAEWLDDQRCGVDMAVLEPRAREIEPQGRDCEGRDGEAVARRAPVVSSKANKGGYSNAGGRPGCIHRRLALVLADATLGRRFCGSLQPSASG